jgi:signal transduction histidine kinase
MHDREIERVVATRESIRGQVPFNGSYGPRIYDYIFVPVLGPDGAVAAVAGTTRDVTDASEAERALRTSQESQAFLLELGDTLRSLADPVAIQATASRMVGEKLAAVRVLYLECEPDGEHFTAERAYEIPGTPAARGRHRLDLLGPAALADLREGRPVAVDDVRGSGACERALLACDALCIRAHVTVPLVKSGRLVALFSVHDSEARRWSAADTALVAETAERTWAAVERARTEAALRVSRTQLLSELAGARRLQQISTELMHEQPEEAVRDRLLGAAIAIMHADAASMHLFNRVSRSLELVAWKGFPDGEAPREAAGASDGGRDVHARPQRVEVADTEQAGERLSPAAMADCLRCGVRALQSTPLVSRSGEVVGMLSTLWCQPHRASEHDFGLFDALARQATELVERSRSDAARRELIAQLAEQDRRKDEFLASLAHELRNPLAPLRNGLELMKLARDDPATTQRARTVMERQLRQMVRLVDDLLDVSRISRGILLLQTAPLDLAAVLASAVETSRPLIDAAGHVLAIELAPEPVVVDADETRLAQAFANLLNNAAKYTDPGGRIGLAMRREGGEAVVTLQDNGVGIPPEMLPRVFEMFTQVDSVREKSRGGLGIG